MPSGQSSRHSYSSHHSSRSGGSHRSSQQGSSRHSSGSRHSHRPAGSGHHRSSHHGHSSTQGQASTAATATHRPITAELSSDMMRVRSHSCKDLFCAVMGNVNRSRLRSKQQEAIEKLRHVLRRDKRHISRPIDWETELPEVAAACDDLLFNGRLRSTNAVAYIPDANLYATTGLSGHTMTDPAEYGDDRAYVHFDTRNGVYWRELCDTRAKKRTAIIATILHEQLHAWSQRFGCTCESCLSPTGDRTVWSEGHNNDGHGVGWRYAANAVSRKLLQWIPELEWHSEQSEWSFMEGSEKNRIDALTVIQSIPEEALEDMQMGDLTDEETYWEEYYAGQAGGEDYE